MDYIAALDLPGDAVVLLTTDERVATLRALRNGVGVTVYTGPEGAAFWLPVSYEVKVRIVPDGTDLVDRRDADLQWALEAVGLRSAEAKRLAAGSPPQRGQWVEVYAKARLLLEKVRYDAPIITIVADGGPPVAIETRPENQFIILDRLKAEHPALDYEYRSLDDYTMGGLAVSTKDRNWYLAVQAADVPPLPGHADALREHVGKMLRDGVPTIWHNGKSDLKAQYIGDPLVLSGKPIDDTILMAYLAGIDITGADLGLKGLTRRLLGRDPMDHPKDVSVLDLPVATAARYAAGGDSRNTYDLYHTLKPVLESRQQMSV